MHTKFCAKRLCNNLAYQVVCQRLARRKRAAAICQICLFPRNPAKSAPQLSALTWSTAFCTLFRMVVVTVLLLFDDTTELYPLRITDRHRCNLCSALVHTTSQLPWYQQLLMCATAIWYIRTLLIIQRKIGKREQVIVE